MNKNEYDSNQLFSPAQVGRAGEDVALQLEAAIVGGHLLPGERLPSERELQVRFRTGRGVVREALGALKQKGLIEVRKGAKGGAFVRQVEVGYASQSLALFLAQQEIRSENLIEFRESIDRTIAILAIARGLPDEKAQLVADTRRLETAVESSDADLALLVEMDRSLNLQFARMARNPIFEWIMKALQLGFRSLDHALYAADPYRRQCVANWVTTARDIAEGEPMQALSCISSHYTMLRRCLKEMRETQTEGRLPGHRQGANTAERSDPC
jgi:DNA-binding FadR family transcriptional regulator